MSDGLAPAIMAKLNNNFRNLKNLIRDPEVNIVSGATAPSPRTDETLWYNTETGDMYIWAEGFTPQTGEPNGEWAWRKMDTNLITFAPYSPSGENYYRSDGQVFWMDTTSGTLWVWCKSAYGPQVAKWMRFDDCILNAVYFKFLNIDNDPDPDFIHAVHVAMSRSDPYA